MTNVINLPFVKREALSVDLPERTTRNYHGTEITKLIASADKVGSVACAVCIHATSLTPQEAAEFLRHFERFESEMTAIGNILNRIVRQRGKTQ